MSKFKPIAMRCTQEQFEGIKPKLEKQKYLKIFMFNKDWNSFYLELFKSGGITNGLFHSGNTEVHEEWNEEIFLDACGIIPETIQDRLANLEKEIKEVKALIEEENKPKKGDICKFWYEDKNYFMIGKLERVVETETYPYYTHDVAFRNCEKITDENFLKAYSKL